jgi:hypothetical protein
MASEPGPLRPDPHVTALAIADGAALLRDTVVVGITPVERAATCVVVELIRHERGVANVTPKTARRVRKLGRKGFPGNS